MQTNETTTRAGASERPKESVRELLQRQIREAREARGAPERDTSRQRQRDTGRDR